ncbi:hypothetical protein PV327_009169 [Microctonus hyperodae]|uniref:Cytochrome P450 n=1 Tax=Microctonus hyperodae TaxID=165561 RepID=A0AA39KVF7_MICHY|nr:hypothetical protein PV327_009169 [Microctonus hyperodae]
MGVPGPKPTAPFGNVSAIIMRVHNIGTYLQTMYNTYKDYPLTGFYIIREPNIIINDFDIIKDVLIKDFSKFSDRGQEIHEKHEPLSLHLFNLEPKRWRLLRKKLTPLFTSGKLKNMFHLLMECANQMKKNLDKIDDEIVDMREIPARFTTDVVGVCAFGLQANALQDETSLFRKIGKRIFDLNFKSIVRFVFGLFLPSLYSNFIGYFTRDNIVDDFIINLTKESMEYRKNNNINRGDFMDLLLALKNQPTEITDDIELTDKLLAAQVFVFFAAGFETSSTTIGNVLYEMAMNPSVQIKLRKEIHDELKRTNGQYDYEGIKNMQYMHKIIQETLRKYPPLPFITRRTTMPYQFAGTNVTIPANVRVWIPLLGIQRDPKYYPNPEVFDPERFSEKNIGSRHEMTFLPFGKGSRNCIGERFAYMQMKVGLIKILENHMMEVCEKTDESYEIDQRAIFVAIYYYLTSTYKQWEKLGVPGPKPTAPFGNISSVIMGKNSIGTYFKEVYDIYKDEPIVGIYKGRQPAIVINDLDLIKDVMIKDFSKFSDRGQETFEKHEPLSIHLFALEPKRWRLLRAKLSPIFTSGKLKDMFYLLIECANQMEQYLNKIDDEIVDMREIPARFTTDVIGVCAFGLQANAIQDESSLFRQMGKRIFALNFKTVVRFVCGFFLPSLHRHFTGYFTRDPVMDNFFISLTKETMEYRKKNNINRRDFIDLLLALKEQPIIAGEDIELTDELLAAQLFVFFAAGFETSSTTIGNTLYEMAMNPSIQSKLRAEIRDELTKSNRKYVYENIYNMKYMTKVIKETLRKYPTVPFLSRRSPVPYKFAGTNITIPARTKIWVSVFGIQKDPKYYPNPEVFDPERFSEENIESRHEMAFLPFGKGSRNCIGERFAYMQMKVGLMKILENHVVEVCEKTDKTYEIDKRGIIIIPKNGIFLRFKKISV